MNSQTCEPLLWLNEAWFSQNGGCGYVLKPPMLRAAAAAAHSRTWGAARSTLVSSTPRTPALVLVRIRIRFHAGSVRAKRVGMRLT